MDNEKENITDSEKEILLENEAENVENENNNNISAEEKINSETITQETKEETEINSLEVIENNVTQNNLENETNADVTDTQSLIAVRPVKFQQFESNEKIRAIKRNLDVLQDISMHVSVELGKAKSSIREVMEMEKGSIVELSKIAGEQVEIYVNEKLVAKGEVIVIEDKFGVRVVSTNLPKTVL